MNQKKTLPPRVHSSEDAGKTAEACARHIMGRLEEALTEKGIATLAVSGGSTPKLMFREMVKAEFDWNLVHLFFVDERMVPPTDDESNFKLAQENLIGPAGIQHEHVHRIVGELTPDGAAARYSLEIQNYFDLKDGQMPHFDVIHQGTGPDAHTASLFPGDLLIEDREGIAGASYSEAKKNWRVTLLPSVLLAARHNVFLVSGEDKAEALRNVFEAEYNPLKYPAQVVMHHGHKVEWFVDKAAARLIGG